MESRANARNGSKLFALFVDSLMANHCEELFGLMFDTLGRGGGRRHGTSEERDERFSSSVIL